MDVYVALVHHPVHNRSGDVVATAVTNLDIHDLARASRTYDVRGTYIVTPIEQQRSLVSRIIGHWQEGEGTAYNPVRAEAFTRVHVAASTEAAAEDIAARSGRQPLLVATGANLNEDAVSYEALRARIADEDGPLLLLFGTGWGLTEEFITRCDATLPAIRAVEGRGGYNHLSVRSAVSIILDRLLGEHQTP
jgi:hypothetical protein